MKYKPKTKPFPHQAKATLAAARARNYAIFFEPRLGKSKVALDYCGVMAMKRPGLKVLILAPRIAIPVWHAQIEQHFPHFAMVEDFEEEYSYAGNTDWITHFFLAGREETFRRTRDPQGGYQREKQDILEAWRPDVIILDESHEYKRPGGVAAQDCWRLVRRLRKLKRGGKPYVLLLSGTPNPKGWIDLFAQFRIMDEQLLGTNAGDFKADHVVYGHGSRKWTVMGYRNTAHLKRIVGAHSITANADDVGLGNKQFFQRLPVALPALVQSLYQELMEEFIVELENGKIMDAANAGVKRMRLLQLCGGFTTDGTEIHRAKVEALQSYLHLLYEQGESVVVYNRFTPEVAASTSVADAVGFRTFRVDGATKVKARRQAIASLATRPSNPTAVVFQHQAGSRAIELVGAAEVVYYSTPDGWVDYRQTLARVQGPNQHRPVRYTHLICPGTVEVSVVRGLQRKEDGHAELMKNPRRYLTGL